MPARRQAVMTVDVCRSDYCTGGGDTIMREIEDEEKDRGRIASVPRGVVQPLIGDSFFFNSRSLALYPGI